MRESGEMRKLGAMTAAAMVLMGGWSVAPASAAEPFLPVHKQRIALPRNVQPWLPTWTADGRNIVFNNQVDGSLWIAGASGGRSKCVSCGFTDRPANLGSGFTYAFPDGKRVFLSASELGATGGADAPGAADAYILECGPTIARCLRHRYLPVDMSADKGGSFIIQRRTWHLAPDGVHLGWMDLRLDGTAMVVATLQRHADRYVAADPRVVNPKGPTGPGDTDADRIENAAQLYELKSFADGGRSVLVVGERASNTDVLKVDLRTGRTTRLTAHPDWDEDGAIAPDGRSQAVASWRTRDRLSVTAWLPQLRDFAGLQLGAALAPYYVSTFEGFQCDLSPWLVSGSGDAGGRLIGQPLDTYSGNLAAGNNLAGLPFWNPGSNAVLLQEKLRTRPPAASNAAIKQKGLTPNRLAVARIDRRPTRPETARTTRIGAWAPPAVAFKGTMSGTRTITARGERGGTATITYTGTLASGGSSVTFHRFTDDGKAFVDGTMSASTADATAKPWRIAIAIKVSGAHTGSMNADLSVNNSTTPLPTKSGTWTATYDGKKAPSLPSLGQCYAKLPKPSPLRVTAFRARARVHVRVTADIYGDRRPVRNARVWAAGMVVRTDSAGRATLRLPGRRPRDLRVTAGDTFRAALLRR